MKRIKPMLWFLLVLAMVPINIVFGWQISPKVRSQFETICQTFDYQSCYKFYWQFQGYYHFVFYLSLIATIIFAALFARSLQRTKKSQ
jgi:hypothetical protein